jgi:3-phosphoshikimate 1-carboxyvinyltransferase
VECLENTAIVNGLPDCSLKIFPGKVDQPQEPFDPADDHRMAFAAALGSLHNGGSVLNPDCVSKSFPGFWEAFHGLKSESVGSRG